MPISPGDLFCENCGTRVDVSPPAQAAPAANPAAYQPYANAAPVMRSDSAGVFQRPVGDSIEEQNAALRQIWPDWTLLEKLGEGSFGKVYKAARTEMGNTFYSAIKIITIPQSPSEEFSIAAEMGLNEQSATSYFKTLVDDCVNEIKMMESFKGTQNIVSVEDYKVMPHAQGPGWTIFIRMELLTSFLAYQKSRQLTEKEVIKLGVDMCNALEFCMKLNVMHRDIKPENIFVSKFGDFKLGDFGIARKLEKSTAGMSKKGTYNYMAPEIYNGKGQYDYKSDIYSLGIVLYKLMNNNRFPLTDPRTDIVTYQKLQEAFERRMAGEKLPKPVRASEALSSVILTACAFSPNNRFANATAMKAALLSVQSGAAELAMTNRTALMAAPAPHPDATVKAPTAMMSPYGAPAGQPAYNAPAPPQKKTKPAKQKKPPMSKGKKALLIIIAVLIVVLGAGGYIGFRYITGPVFKIDRALKKGDYDAALDAYRDDDSGKAAEKMVSAVTERIGKLKEDYLSGAKDYATVTAELDTIEAMKISELTETIRAAKENLKALNASSAAYDTAEALYKKEDYAGALENYKKVIPEDTKYNDAMAKIADATKKYRDKELAKAAEYTKAKNYASAIAELENALTVLKDDTELTKQLELYKKDQASQNKQDTLADALQAADAGNYQAAIQTLLAARAQFENDADIEGALKTYSDAYRSKVTAAADGYLRDSDYAKAIAALEDALKTLPDDAALKEKLNQCKQAQQNQSISEIRSQAQAQREEGNYEAAIRTLQGAAEKYPDDADVAADLASVTDEYLQKVLSKVNTAVSDRDYGEALKLLNAAKELLPDNETVNKKLAEVNANKPVNVRELKVLNENRDWSENVTKPEDALGYEYYDCVNYFTMRHDTYGEYYIEGKYKIVTGQLSSWVDMGEGHEAHLQIYADGKVIYTSPKITQKTKAFTFTVELPENTQYIKFIADCNEHWYAHILVTDLLLWTK